MEKIIFSKAKLLLVYGDDYRRTLRVITRTRSIRPLRLRRLNRCYRYRGCAEKGIHYIYGSKIDQRKDINRNIFYKLSR